MKTKLFLLFALSLVLVSCEDKKDEPWNPQVQTNNVTIVALTGNTLHSMSTSDKQVKTTTVDDSYGVLKCLFLHNGEMMLFSKASDGFRMMKFDGDNITDNNKVTLLNDFLGDPWWVSVSNTNNSYCYVCDNYSEDKYVIVDENGNSKEFSYMLNNGDITSFQYSLRLIDGNGNFYHAYLYSREFNPSGNWIVEKNGQKLYQVNGNLTALRMCIVGNDVYLLGYNSDGKGAYAVNSKVVVDEEFSAITCASVLDGQLCLGGFKTNDYKVNKATMKIGGKYSDLTYELGWYEHKDFATGSGNNHSSCVESLMVENNMVFALVRKYSQVNPWVAGGDDYFVESGDAIFCHTQKLMDLGDKHISSFVVIPEKK